MTDLHTSRPDDPEADDARSTEDGTTCETAVSRRRLATRTRLLDAARSVFAARGVHGSSVEEICEAAGFTRGAFYSNYADKEELTRDLLRREQARILETVQVDSVSTDIESAVEAILTAQKPRVDYFVIQYELQLHALRTREFAPILAESEAAFRDVVRTILERELHRLHLEPVIGLTEITEAVTALTERSIRRATLTGADDLLGLARTVLPHMLRGFTGPSGEMPRGTDSPVAEQDS